jgi:hypothetical protein
MVLSKVLRAGSDETIAHGDYGEQLPWDSSPAQKEADDPQEQEYFARMRDAWM